MKRVKSIAGAAWRWLVASYKASPASAPVLPIEPKLELSLAEQVERQRVQIEGLTNILRTLAGQTNHNTTTLMRWATSVPMLAEVERKHAKGEQIRQARRTKRGGIIAPESTIEVVPAIGPLVGVDGR